MYAYKNSQCDLVVDKIRPEKLRIKPCTRRRETAPTESEVALVTEADEGSAVRWTRKKIVVAVRVRNS